jgi:muramidase (phage lysozyme)
MTVYQISSTTYGNLVDVEFDNNVYEFSDHGRESLTVSTNRIEVTRRTANGSRRRYHIADKVSFDVSWTSLPGQSTNTVDGKLGAEELEAMYQLSLATGEVDVRLANKDLTDTTYAMHISNFSKRINKRFATGYYYDVSISFEEI